MKTFSIKFNTNCNIELENIALKAKKPIPTLPVLERAGYNFLGWYWDSNCSNEFKLEVMPKYDIEIYAKWEVATLDAFLSDIDFFTKSANILQNLQNDYTDVPNFRDVTEKEEKEKKTTKKTTKKKSTAKKKTTKKKSTTKKSTKKEVVEEENKEIVEEEA